MFDPRKPENKALFEAALRAVEQFFATPSVGPMTPGGVARPAVTQCEAKRRKVASAASEEGWDRPQASWRVLPPQWK